MSILKINCPHCNFTYVLPESKVPSGDLTVTCQHCQKTYVYNKLGTSKKLSEPAASKRLQEPGVSADSDQKTPLVENRPFYMQSSASKPVTGDEPKKEQASSSETVQSAPGVESRISTDWRSIAPPKKAVSDQATKEKIPESTTAEEKPSFGGWQPVVPQEEPAPVQTPEKIPESPAIVEKSSFGSWQPVVAQEEPEPVQTPTENIPESTAAEEKHSFGGWQPVAPSESSEAESGFKPQPDIEVREEPKQVQASAGYVTKAPAVEQKPAPVQAPAKKVVNKSARTAGRAGRGIGKKLIVAVVLVCAIGAIAYFVVNKPAEVANEVAKIKEKAVDIKQDVSTLVKEKFEPKPVIIPAEPSVEISPEEAIVRPANFKEIAGTWTGKLRGDAKGQKWTFSFNPANYDISIKNDSGFWVKGTAAYHWDKGAGGDTLRVAPRWNVLDIDVVKSSVSDDAGKTSLGAFWRYQNDVKLCMSRPGSMVEPTESSNADIQCFDLKKKE